MKTQTTVQDQRVRHGERRMLFLVEKYMELHPDVPVNLDDVVEWALNDQKVKIEPLGPAQILKRRISRAMKAERFIDPQNREVRKWHSVHRTEDGRSWTEWATLLDADPGHMRLSLKQHRDLIFDNCKQHKLVFDSYNDNNKFGAKLAPTNYNFELDFAETGLPTKYPMEKPEED